MGRRELYITWGTLLISGIFLILMPFQTVDIKHGGTTGISVTPSTFPLFTLVLMGGLSLNHLISYYKRKSQGEGVKIEEEDIAISPVILSVIVLLLYTFLMDKIGFVLDTILLCTIMAVYFKAKIWQIAVAGGVMPILINFLFKLMYVNLPTGFWN